MRKWLLIILASLLVVAYFYRYEKLGEEYVDNYYYITYTKDRWLNQAWATINLPADGTVEVAIAASKRYPTREAVEKVLKQDMTLMASNTDAVYWKGIGTGAWGGMLGSVLIGVMWYSRKRG